MAMTRDDHQAEAERLVAGAGKIPPSQRAEEAHRLLAAAQVHATLAARPYPAPAPAVTAPKPPA
jgi:hypothetical protein